MKKTTSPSFTASKFAALVGCDRHQLIRRLGEANARPASESGRGAEYALRDLVNAAVGGDAAAERVRKLRLECSKLEHDLAVRRRDYVVTEEVVKAGQWVFTAVREIIWRSPLDEDTRRAILHELVGLRDHDWRKGSHVEPDVGQDS